MLFFFFGNFRIFVDIIYNIEIFNHIKLQNSEYFHHFSTNSSPKKLYNKTRNKILQTL